MLGISLRLKSNQELLTAEQVWADKWHGYRARLGLAKYANDTS